MTGLSSPAALSHLYRLTIVIASIGCFLFLIYLNLPSGFAFAIGSIASLGNLWLFARMSGSIAPGPQTRKPWTGGVFLIRYIVLLGIGYATVKFLGANPLAVVSGLLTSAAAVLAYSIFELIASLLGTRRSH